MLRRLYRYPEQCDGSLLQAELAERMGVDLSQRVGAGRAESDDHHALARRKGARGEAA
jgi:hypothetical protein